MKGLVVNVKWERKQEIHTVQRDKKLVSLIKSMLVVASAFSNNS